MLVQVEDQCNEHFHNLTWTDTVQYRILRTVLGDQCGLADTDIPLLSELQPVVLSIIDELYRFLLAENK